MMNGASAVLFVKQLDFMLLGVDHFVNTYNVMRSEREIRARGSFSIVTIVCDHGQQGPQSSFNALSDLCSLARVPGYTLTNSADAKAVLGSQLGAPGFRFIALSQRLFPSELLQLDADFTTADASILSYQRGDDATIVCLNFSLPEGLALAHHLRRNGRSSTVFSVNPVFPLDWSPIVADVMHTRRLLVLDDTKGAVSVGYELLQEVAESVPMSRGVLRRRPKIIPFGVDAERFEVDYEELAASMFTRAADAETTERPRPGLAATGRD
jgi:pyruvate/2-oxoglutarate/acetoin dehydrogenase E1 component